jgi:hypothetical protein
MHVVCGAPLVEGRTYGCCFVNSRMSLMMDVIQLFTRCSRSCINHWVFLLLHTSNMQGCQLLGQWVQALPCWLLLLPAGAHGRAGRPH